jgi:hypothetical protein
MSAQPVKKQKRSNEGSSNRDFQEWWSSRFGMIIKGDNHYASYVTNQRSEELLP